MQLFEQISSKVPLAERLRPKSILDMVGQQHLLKSGGILENFTTTGFLPSIILWGYPGCGKTTLANIIATEFKKLQPTSHFVTTSAITSGVADLKKIFDAAASRKKDGQETLLFVDEIHRFNKSQQDLFLPYLENGTVTLIGATTENPSFELNSALLSRCKVITLNRLDEAALLALIAKAEDFYARKIPLEQGALTALCAMADGDGRALLNICEEIFNANIKSPLNAESLSQLVSRRAALYDKSSDGHYNLISALHKSLRGSDVDAALYWFARMLEGGEDPKYLIRRLIRFAVEDIGMADPQAVVQANASLTAFEMLGSPEGELAIAQAVIYLATAPKSIGVYSAYKNSRALAKAHGSLSPPKHILNAPTKLMKDQGYSDGYIYDPETPNGFSGQNYFPDEMNRVELYHPRETGFEREITKRLDYWKKLRDKK